jgi:DNA-binding response OmpR family regulator
MIESSISAQQDEDRQAFLSYLPKRIVAFEQRIERYRKEGWDSAGMLVLRGDVQRLAEASGRSHLIETRRLLQKLAQSVSNHIAKRSAPDAQQTERMIELLSAVTASLALAPEPLPRSSSSETAHAAVFQSRAPTATMERAVPAEPVKSVEPFAVADPVASSKSAQAVASIEPIERVMPTQPASPIQPVKRFERDDSATTSETGMRRIYHLSDRNTFSIELGKRLESAGFTVETLTTVDELSELVKCLMPQSVLVDASRMSDLRAIGIVRREAQQRSRIQRHVHMVAMTTQDTLEARRAAHRAGVDLLLTPPFDSNAIVDRLQALHASAAEEKVRVLIVEDNRADAFYAQTVLINAGMQAHVERDPMQVLESLNLLHPDLVLMDLHMPFANGVEVTMLIREHPVFARVPIVFLSGESDPDSRLEAINAGGDDFLFKPIRPKHLVDAVRDRMRRMHPIGK